MAIEICEGVADEAEEILALQKRAYQSEAELYNDYNIPPLTETLSEIKSEFQKKKFLIAVEGNRIIGSIRADELNETCHIGRVIVEPEYQGQGIGTALMKEVEVHFPNVKRFELFTGERSLKNIRFYEKLGYRQFRSEKITDDLVFVFLEKII